MEKQLDKQDKSFLSLNQNILLVDDDKDQLELFKILFSKKNYSVLTAETAEDAEEMLQTLHVDLVVTDVNMPSRSGLELIRALRRASNLEKLPVISFSASKYKSEEMKAKGADNHFDKTNLKGLLSEISSMLSTQRKSSSLLEQIQERYSEVD